MSSEEWKTGENRQIDQIVPTTRLDDKHYLVDTCGQQVYLRDNGSSWTALGYCFVENEGARSIADRFQRVEMPESLSGDTSLRTVPIVRDDRMLYRDIRRVVNAISGKDISVDYATETLDFKLER